MASPQQQEHNFRAFDNLYQILPQGHEKALKHAFYNTLAIIFVIVACAAGIAVYFILESFLRPLLWAVLCGTFLYPFKRSLTGTLRRWLNGLNTSGTPFILGFVLLPVTVVDRTSEGLSSAILKNLKLILAICAGVPAIYLLYHFGPLRKIYCICHYSYNTVYDLLGYFSSLWAFLKLGKLGDSLMVAGNALKTFAPYTLKERLKSSVRAKGTRKTPDEPALVQEIWTLALGYMLLVIFCWTPQASRYVRYLGVPVWGALLLHVAAMTGPFRMPLLLVVVVMVVVGYISERRETQPTEPETVGLQSDIDSPAQQQPWTSRWPLSLVFETRPVLAESTTADESADSRSPDASTVPPPTKPKPTIGTPGRPTPIQPTGSSLKPSPFPSAGRSDSRSDLSLDLGQQQKREKSLSDKCFIALFYGIVLLKLWTHVWILQLLLPLPFAVMLVKKLVSQFFEGGLLGDKLKPIRESLTGWVQSRQEVLAPRPIRGFFKLVMSCDRKMLAILEQSLDKATSILLILILVVGTILFTILFAVQVHQESMQMVTLTSNVLNNSLPPDMTRWLPTRDDMQTAMDSMAGNAYMYGRDWIADRVRETGDGSNSTHLEKQLLELWDRLYESWFAKNSTSVSRRHSTPLSPGIDNLTSVWEAVSSNGLAVGGAIDFVKANIGTFVSVLESVWVVLKGNLSLFFSSITAMISMVFGGGTAVLNFVISAVIFLTTLFYLLASSGDKYKPMEIFTTISPSQTGQKFGQAVEEAISGVFMASVKMGLFYGLYTWFTHSMFGIQIIFIPAALAAIFAAIPFLGTYWAAIPGVLELWLVQREGVLAAILFVAHMLPTYVVDTAIYSEIQGGHPYMTGLAIAGGMFCMGLEGAIIGPILLCCLIVTMNVYSSFLKSDPSTPTPSGVHPGDLGKHPSGVGREGKRVRWNLTRSVSSDDQLRLRMTST